MSTHITENSNGTVTNAQFNRVSKHKELTVNNEKFNHSIEAAILSCSSNLVQFHWTTFAQSNQRINLLTY